MRRMILLFVVSAILVLALAVPAFAKNLKLDPDNQGEPVLSGSLNNGVHGAFHCGPFFDLFGVENVHGALTSGGGGNCVQAPQE